MIEKDNFAFTLENDGEYHLLLYMGANPDLVLPGDINGKPYVLDDQTFFHDQTIITLTLSQGITSVPYSCFEQCEFLTKVTVNQSVTRFFYDAFDDCQALEMVDYLGTIDQWATIVFENYSANPLYNAQHLYLNGVEVTEVNITKANKVGEHAFHNATSITEVTLGDSVKEIESCAFYCCSGLKTVTLSNSLTSIGSSAFSHCVNLKTVNFQGSVEEWNKIPKGDYWSAGIISATVICTDGKVDIE